MAGTIRLKISDSEMEWVERLEQIAPRIRSLYTDSQSIPGIEPGSAFKGDQVGWLEPGLSAEYQINIALEHLSFALDSVIRHQVIYPTAQLTIGRTAFMAAINAIWIIIPISRKERRSRAFTLKAKEIQEQLSAISDLPSANSEGALRLRQKQASLTEIGQSFQHEKDAKNDRFSQTKTIKTVAKELASSNVDPTDEFRSTICPLWRMSSAAAHGYYHHALDRVSLPTSHNLRYSEEFVLLDAKVDTDLGPLLLTTFHILEEAIRIFKLRASNHIRR